MSATEHMRKDGFTLVEMIVALAIFSLVMVGTMGALLSMIDAGHKAQALRSVMDNLNLVVEGMSRNIRTGSNYQMSCAPGSGFSNCSSGNRIYNKIVFTAYDGRTLGYQINLSTKRIEVSDSTINGGAFFPITDPQININYLFFRTLSYQQPLVVIIMNGTVVGGTAGQAKTQTPFYIQTSVSQLLLQTSGGG